MENDIKVSIICNAYNHEKYVGKALDGFLMQKTDFKYEVLIHDDASTDRTADVIREYEKKHPNIINPIYQTENQYSKGVGINDTYQYPRVRGKYIALCEGDDYWTDPYKLQKQFDAMEMNPDVDMCSHDVSKMRNGECVGTFSPSRNKCILKTEDVIKGGGSYLATNSLFYRKDMLKHIPRFRKFLRLDYSLQIWGSLRGGILYLPDNMACYRVGVEQSWTSRMGENPGKYIDHLNKTIQMCEILDEETAGKYKKAIQQHVAEIWVRILELSNYSREYSLGEFMGHLSHLTLKKSIKVIGKLLLFKIGYKR